MLYIFWAGHIETYQRTRMGVSLIWMHLI